MRKLFKGLGKGKKIAGRIASKRKQKSGSEKSVSRGSSVGGYDQSSDNKKTRIGKHPEMPFDNQAISEELTCNQCQYHLRTNPSISSPCPNCGFTGNQGNHDTRSDRKTVDVSGLDMASGSPLSHFSFNLVAEAIDSIVKIESEESELTLNRNHLDPGNNSISSDQHILMRFREGKIYISDVSSSGSTFIQAQTGTAIDPGTRIVLGNKIYLFSQDSVEGTRGSHKTKQFKDLRIGVDNNTGFVLIEENSGKSLKLNKGVNVLNRQILDPENASISGGQHARIEFNAGQWQIIDVSSNKATFVQVKTEMLLSDQLKLIIGNTVFRFEY